MLAKLQNYESQVSLIEASGIQFLDFGFCNNLKMLSEGNFINSDKYLNTESEILPTLLTLDNQGNLNYPGNKKQKFSGNAKYFSSGLETLKAFDSAWVPIPYFQQNTDGKFVKGPMNWARARIKVLDEPDDEGNLFRLTLAFDTNAESHSFMTDEYLSPVKEDIESGKVFSLVAEDDLIDDYLSSPWVHRWIFSEWKNGLRTNKNEKLSSEQVNDLLSEWPSEAYGKYKHFLSLIAENLKLPRIKFIANSVKSKKAKIETNLILDIGNSRTCAVVLEKHPAHRGDLDNSYTLQLRDLGQPHLVYTEPFESRVEFTSIEFGSMALSRESGRHDAFLWPTFTRVGREANRLATRRRGTEGATGISGPKRYLWDEEEFPLDWRFNQPDAEMVEPLANEGVFVGLVNQVGDALCDLDQDDPDRFPVISPRYSRSSLMTFGIAEILSQTLGMINSPSQRMRMPNYDLVRALSKIVLTIPPAMPLQEQVILKKRAMQACKLVWQSLGHLDDDGNPVGDEHPPLPEVVIKYDEATCSQVVWLYSMIVSQFGGSAPSMFRALKRPFGQDKSSENELRVASIDIGGGTTDLVITDYSLEGSGEIVTIVPNQIFREGFTIAGDDILKRVVQAHVISAIESEIKNSGISDPTSITKELFGADRANEDIQVKTLRRQCTTQVLAPLGLALIKEYENIAKVASLEPQRKSIKELISTPITPRVVSFINDVVHKAGGTNFDLLKINLLVDLVAVDQTVESGTELIRVLEALCEVVYAHNCDVLLLTGRPTKLKGVVSTVKKQLAMPIERIIQMNGFRCGTWYPFHEYGVIGDPKTTAAVGAMLCTLSEGGIANFLFSSERLNLKSTTKFIGKLSIDGQIANQDIFYSDVKLDDPDYALPETNFDFRGPMWIGFRQLPIERWRASLIYIIDYADEDAKRKLHSLTPLKVSLKRDVGKIRRGETERFEIAEILSKDGAVVNRRSLKLQLQTLPDNSGYWLDSGHVKEA